MNKLPEYLRFYRTLPLTPAGKIDKKALAEEARELGIPGPYPPEPERSTLELNHSSREHA